MTVLCVNSTVVYADITAAVAAEAGISYGVPTRFEQTGVSSSAVTFSDVDFLNSFIYIATSGEETDGTTSIGAQCTGLITTSVTSGLIQDLRTGRITFNNAVGHSNLNLVSNGGGGDAHLFDTVNAASSTNCIRYNCSEGCRATATNDSYIETNCTVVDASGFGVLRPRAVDSVSLNTTSSAYLQVGATSSNYWADDGTGSNAITEGTPTDIFENYATGDYRIKATSSPGVAGAGAFINASSGISLTATLGTIEYTSNDSVVSLIGAIDVTATLGSISYSSNDSIISFTGSVDVIATLGTINYSSNNSVIQISGETNLTATLGTIEYTSNDTAISLFGNIDVVATLGAINYNSNDVSISLTGGVNVNATLGTIDYTSSDTTILLQGQVSVLATLGAISYDGYSVNVQVGSGQFIGTVTTGFANDIYSAGFKPSAITVNFKS